MTPMAAWDEDCLFCKIVAGDIPADVVHETDDARSRSATSTRRRPRTCW